MFYSGQADWQHIADVVSAVKIPVVGNGDVTCATDALNMVSQTGCMGVAVARAAQGNPWIFREIKLALEGKPDCKPTFAERAEMAIKHMNMEIELRGEKSAVMNMRKHIAWYLTEERDSAKIRSAIIKLESAREVLDCLENIAQGGTR